MYPLLQISAVAGATPHARAVPNVKGKKFNQGKVTLKSTSQMIKGQNRLQCSRVCCCIPVGLTLVTAIVEAIGTVGKTVVVAGGVVLNERQAPTCILSC